LISRKVYEYSLWWRIAVIAIPLAAAVLYRWNGLKLELFQQTSGVAILLNRYDIVYAVLAVRLLTPYVLVLYVVSARFVIDSTGITKKSLFGLMSLKWNDIFEYRDLMYVLELLPLKSRQKLYIDYYMNLSESDEFNKDVIRFCKKNEVNMLVKPATRRLIWGVPNAYLIFGLVFFSGIAVVFFPVDLVFPGMMAGTVHVFLCGAFVFISRWLDSNSGPYRILSHALFIVLFLVPLIVLAAPLWGRAPWPAYCGVSSYVTGFMGISGVLEMMFRERQHADEGRMLVSTVE